MLRLDWKSVNGVQTGAGSSQSVVFQTPPSLPPTYMTFGLLGSAAATSTRPATIGALKLDATGAGPIGVQAVVLNTSGPAGSL